MIWRWRDARRVNEGGQRSIEGVRQVEKGDVGVKYRGRTLCKTPMLDKASRGRCTSKLTLGSPSCS